MLYRQRRMLLLPSQPGRDCHNAIYTPGTSNVSSTYVCERLIDSTTPTDYPAQRLRCPGKSRVAGAHGARTPDYATRRYITIWTPNPRKLPEGHVFIRTNRPSWARRPCHQPGHQIAGRLYAMSLPGHLICICWRRVSEGPAEV